MFPGCKRKVQPSNLPVQIVYRCNVMAIALFHSRSEYRISGHDFPAAMNGAFLLMEAPVCCRFCNRWQAQVVWARKPMSITNYDFDLVPSNALQWLSTPEVILKQEKRSVIVNFACSCLPTGFVKSLSFQMLVFVMVVCVLLVVVWLWPLCRHLVSSYSRWMR